MVPNKLFVQLATEIGLPDAAQLKRLDALQLEWARQGRPLSLFELAQAEGILDDDLARRFIRAADERRAAAPLPRPSLRLGADQVRLGADQVRLGADQVRLGADQVRLRADQVRLRADQVRLRADQVRGADPGQLRCARQAARAAEVGRPARRRAAQGEPTRRARAAPGRASQGRAPDGPPEAILVAADRGRRRSAAAGRGRRCDRPAVSLELNRGRERQDGRDQDRPGRCPGGRAPRSAGGVRGRSGPRAGSGRPTRPGPGPPRCRAEAPRGSRGRNERARGAARPPGRAGGATRRAQARRDRARSQDPRGPHPPEDRAGRAARADRARGTRGPRRPALDPQGAPLGQGDARDDDDDDDEGDPPSRRVARRDPVAKPPPSKPPRPTPSKPTPTTTGSDTPRAGGKTGGSGAGGLDPDYVARRDALDRKDAKGFTALGKWARRKRLFEEEKEALNLALIADPNHTSAKKLLTKLLAREKKHRNFHTPWRRDAKVIYVETNTSEALLHYYCDSVAAFYQRFSKIFNVRRSPLKAWGKKIGVKIFATRKDFQRYQVETGSSPSESAVGYYSLKNKELILYYDPNDPAETLDTLFHEGTHLFVHLALGEQVQFLPIWLSEGIAGVLGPSRLDRKKKDLKFGSPSYGRLRHARSLVKANTLSLKGHLLKHTDYGSFGSARYALAWALVHMLIEKKRGKKHKYRGGFVRYFDLVSKNRDPVAGFEEVFGPTARMEAEWLAYIKSFPLPALEEARALAREDKHAEAAPLFEQHCAKNPKDPIGPFLLAESLYELRKYDAAIAAYRRAIALNRNYADAYLGLALSLNFNGQAKESVAPAQRAVSISPTAANYIVLATCALDAKDKATGQRAIRQAISLAGPSRWLLDIKRRIDAL